jgi:hypothetical protein
LDDFGVRRKPASLPAVGPAARPAAAETPPASVPEKSKGWGPKAGAGPSRSAQAQSGFAPAKTPAKAPTREQLVQEVLADGPKGVVGEAVAYWDAQGAKGGLAGGVGKVMSGLLEVSGLPAVERSAGELGARVGVGDSKANIALAGGKLALDSAVVLANGLTAGRASMAVAGVRTAGEAVASTVVRHYTSAATAEKIMQSGEIWASKVGNAGLNKVYLLAEDGAGKSGMNLLRRLNVGYADGAKVAKAIEFDLSKLPADVAQKFVQSAASGPLGLEKFITHSGSLNFEAFRGAVRVLDAEGMKVTMGQLGKAGASLGKMAAALVDTDRGAKAAVK